MKLTSWYISGYRNLCEVSLETSQGVLIAGNNNTGKSNILRSIADYAALFSEPQEHIPPDFWHQQEARLAEDSESDSDDQESYQDYDLTWPDWFDQRTSGDLDAAIEFRATFRPEGQLSGDALEDISSWYLNMLMEIQSEFHCTEQWMQSCALKPDAFTEFTHSMVITRDGISEAYLETDFEGANVVIGGRNPTGAVRDIEYAKIGNGNDDYEFGLVSELTQDSLSPDKIEELTREEAGVGEDEVHWYQEHRPGNPRNSTHGGVIPDPIFERINDDVLRWRHVSAVRAPARSTPSDGIPRNVELDEDYSNVLEYLFSEFVQNTGEFNETTGRYERIITDVTAFGVETDQGEEGEQVVGIQRESGADQEFSSRDISTGSLQVLCLLAALHAQRQPTDDADTVGSIITIEEPETHLNPHTQRKILDYILEGLEHGIAPVLTSHSPILVDQSRIGQTQVTIQRDGETTVEELGPSAREQLRIRYDTTLSDLLQANALLVIPNEYWRVFFQAIASQAELNLTERGVTTVVCTSTQGRSLIADVCQTFEIPLIINDRLAPDDQQQLTSLAHQIERLELPTASVVEYIFQNRDQVTVETPGDQSVHEDADEAEAWFWDACEDLGINVDLSKVEAITEFINRSRFQTDFTENTVDLFEGYRD